MNDPRDKALAAALLRMKRQRAAQRQLRSEDIPLGMGHNQFGPPPQTNATPNNWPTDGEH